MATSTVGGRKRVKDPFKTLASLYIPNDIKKAFRMPELVYKTNILILRALYKLAEYPITPLKFSAVKIKQENADDDLSLTGDQVEETYRKIFEDHLDFNKVLIELNLNYYLYSNDFPMLYMPFDRLAACKECVKKAKAKIPKDAKDSADRRKNVRQSLEVPIEELKDLKWTDNKFKAKCPRCGKNQEREFSSRDVPARNNYAGVSMGRLILFRLEIQELEFSGLRRYLYTVSDTTKKNIKKNDRFTLAHEPMVVLKAVAKDKKVEYFSHSVFHFKMPSPVFETNSPWAWPLLVSAFQTIFFIQTMRRGAEAIAYEHITPKPFIAPGKELDNLLSKYDMSEVKKALKDSYEESQKDDAYMAVLPLPVTTGILNQHGRAFLPQQEIAQATRELLTGLGIAEGLLTGQGPFSANSIAVRILENGFLSQRDMSRRFIKYVQKIIQGHFGLPPCEVDMTDFRKLDDSLHKQLVSGAVNAKQISTKTFVKELGYDPIEEREQIKDEIKDETEYQAEMEGVLEASRSETMSKSQAAQAALETERMISEMEKRTGAITTMIEGLIDKKYPKEWVMKYVSQYMEIQTANAERSATMARSLEAQDAYMRDRMGNATTGLNRAEDKMRMHRMMDQGIQNPSDQMYTQEQGDVANIVRRAQLMSEGDRNRYLDHMEAENPVLHEQVISMLGQPPEG